MSAVPSSPAAPAPEQRLSEQALRRIDGEIAKYPADQRQSAVLAALAIAQDQIGWLPSSVMEEVAAYLHMPPIAVYEVATFYHMFHLAPVGRHKITICTNLSCALSGANVAARHLQQKLGIDFGETTADGRFTLVQGECMGACGDAPVLLVDNKHMHSFMDASKLDALLESLVSEKGK
ncbi:MAG TPA: NADH-quinone oxidoreductase subunit NuoE [Burkholderiaceae bacterium]|nr:NADH-quinone oxidoreductase subunit NuoE [Burkholderiaceae bacterium]